jgi:hypothetical protein
MFLCVIFPPTVLRRAILGQDVTPLKTGLARLEHQVDPDPPHGLPTWRVIRLITSARSILLEAVIQYTHDISISTSRTTTT